MTTFALNLDKNFGTRSKFSPTPPNLVTRVLSYSAPLRPSRRGPWERGCTPPTMLVIRWLSHLFVEQRKKTATFSNIDLGEGGEGVGKGDTWFGPDSAQLLLTTFVGPAPRSRAHRNTDCWRLSLDVTMSYGDLKPNFSCFHSCTIG